LALYKDCIWVTFEDRVFDVTDLDHPGGRFILSTIKGKDVSRFMVGGLEYNDTDSRDYIVNRHSPFALNLLEKM
jgi:cytochrome b involved in lipid metabolism